MGIQQNLTPGGDMESRKENDMEKKVLQIKVNNGVVYTRFDYGEWNVRTWDDLAPQEQRLVQMLAEPDKYTIEVAIE